MRVVSVLLAGALVAAAILVTVSTRAEPPVVHARAFSADAGIREQDIAFYEARVRADTMGSANLARLGQLYLQRAREQGDLNDYQRAEHAARRSLALRDNGAAALVRASSLLALHRFPEALEAASGLCDDLPGHPSYCALLAEIQLEMGDYDAARVTFDRLAPFRGTLGVAPRIARWFEITGRTDDAVALLQGALEEALRRSDLPREQVAWFCLRTADIALRNGRLRDAERALRTGLRIEPADARLLSAMMRLFALRHDWKNLLAYGARVGDAADIATLALMGDAHAQLGNTGESERFYRLAEMTAQQNPEPFNRQWTLFRLDHARDIPATLELLRAEIELRKDVYGWDQLAWALYRAGHYSDARNAMRQALRMGTRDAVLYFHAGIIERALGERATAARYLREALGTNPHFHHVFPAWARAALDSVQAGL
jgi:tetratricopeptide (TPR) repeat protein